MGVVWGGRKKKEFVPFGWNKSPFAGKDLGKQDNRRKNLGPGGPMIYSANL